MISAAPVILTVAHGCDIPVSPRDAVRKLSRGFIVSYYSADMALACIDIYKALSVPEFILAVSLASSVPNPKPTSRRLPIFEMMP